MPAPQIVYYQLGAIKVSWPYCVSFIFGHRVTFFYCPPRRRRRFVSKDFFLALLVNKNGHVSINLYCQRGERQPSPGQQWERTVVVRLILLILMLILIHIHTKIQCACHSARFPGQFV